MANKKIKAEDDVKSEEGEVEEIDASLDTIDPSIIEDTFDEYSEYNDVDDF
jgi:hypothetical protein